MVGQSLLRNLACKSIRHPYAFLAGSVLLAALSLWVTGACLVFKTDRNDLVSGHQKYVQLEREYESEFTGLIDFIVVIRAADPAKARRFADALAAELQKSKDVFEDVFYRFDGSLLEGKKLLLLDSEDLKRLADGVTEHQEMIEGLFQSPSLYQVCSSINQRMKQELVKTGVQALIGNDKQEQDDEEDARRLQFISTLFREMAASLKAGNYAYRSPWKAFLGGEGLDRDAYLTTADKQYLVMQVLFKQGEGFLKDLGPLRLIRAAVGRLQASQFPDIEAGVTGQPALAADEMATALNDMQLASILSLVGVAVLYIIAFREVRRPLMVVLCLLVGMAWTMGFLTLTVGHLTVLTVAFSSILIGLGIDFGFHLLARYEEERARGHETVPALETALKQTLPGLLACATTAALAFFAVMLADFRGIQELGWISGGGILLTLLSMVFCLPPLLVLTERGAKAGKAAREPAFAPAFARFVQANRLAIVAAALALTVLSLVRARTVSFDYNLLNLQSKGTESVVWEKRLLGAAERSSWYAITVAANEEELLAKQKRFEALSSVSQVRSILDIKPEAGEQERRIALVRGVRDAFEGMELGELPSPPRPDVPKLKTMLDKVKLTLRNKSAEEAGKLAAEIDVARNELLALIDALGSTAEKDAADRLAAFQSPFFEDFRDKFDLLRKNLNPTPITLADIPESILRRFVSPQGRYLMHLYSAKDIWQREAMAEFANQLRAADPAATGAPIIGSESIRLMAQGYLQGGLYAFSAIVIVVLLTFRGVRDTILCLSPVLVAAVWTLGLMGVAGIQFNLANLIVVPLVLGVSVDGAILMLDRAREEGCATALLLSSASRAVLLSMLTTMVGFGALMVADHYGIFSLGLLLTLAVGSALVATLTALPAVLFYVFPGRQVARQDEGQVATPST